MPSSHRQKPKARAPARPSRPAAKKPAAKKPVARPAPPKAKTAGRTKPVEKPVPEVVPPPRPTGRIHVLSLSFVRDGDEFLARMETDGGQITELKNRSLDQLLTLVASELEDLLE
jgi:outer membrane biosynthesis protein TonB